MATLRSRSSDNSCDTPASAPSIRLASPGFHLERAPQASGFLPDLHGFHLERTHTIRTIRAISPFQVEAFRSYTERSSFNRRLQWPPSVPGEVTTPATHRPQLHPFDPVPPGFHLRARLPPDLLGFHRASPAFHPERPPTQYLAFHLERTHTIRTVRAISPFQVEAFCSYQERSSFNRRLQ